MILWPWILASLILAGCAADTQRVEQEEQYKSVQAPRETSRPAEPRARTTPPAQERPKKAPPETARAERRESAQPQAEEPRTQPETGPKPEQHARIPAEQLTPLDQSGSKDDIEVTRRIRKALMNEDLSFGAKNVLVITQQDRVVLKGTVNSPSEAERVKGVAAMITMKQIEDRLEIERQ
jgi:outer membrane biosynthesis protein TonB